MSPKPGRTRPAIFKNKRALEKPDKGPAARKIRLGRKRFSVRPPKGSDLRWQDLAEDAYFGRAQRVDLSHTSETYADLLRVLKVRRGDNIGIALPNIHRDKIDDVPILVKVSSSKDLGARYFAIESNRYPVLFGQIVIRHMEPTS